MLFYPALYSHRIYLVIHNLALFVSFLLIRMINI
jgi:hypothetical protein